MIKIDEKELAKELKKLMPTIEEFTKNDLLNELKMSNNENDKEYVREIERKKLAKRIAYEAFSWDSTSQFSPRSR